MLKSVIGMNDEMSLGIGKGFNSGIKLTGNMLAELFDKNGILKNTREVHNVDTTLAHAMVANRISASATIVVPGWMELGTGTGQSASDSTLATYISGSRTALDSSVAVAAVLTMICTFPAGTGTGAVTEAGTFNVVTQNTTDLITYADFAVINKGAGDSLVVTWTLEFS